jgi:hypothetical protein
MTVTTRRVRRAIRTSAARPAALRCPRLWQGDHHCFEPLRKMATITLLGQTRTRARLASHGKWQNHGTLPGCNVWGKLNCVRRSGSSRAKSAHVFSRKQHVSALLARAISKRERQRRKQEDAKAHYQYAEEIVSRQLKHGEPPIANLPGPRFPDPLQPKHPRQKWRSCGEKNSHRAGA